MNNNNNNNNNNIRYMATIKTNGRPFSVGEVDRPERKPAKPGAPERIRKVRISFVCSLHRFLVFFPVLRSDLEPC